MPARFAGRRLQIKLGATTVTAVAQGVVVARHVRSIHKYSEDLQLDHYLEVLARKPGALAGSTALEAAVTTGRYAQQRWSHSTSGNPLIRPSPAAAVDLPGPLRPRTTTRCTS